MTPAHHLTSCEANSKSIKTLSFQKNRLYNNSFSSEKVIFSESGETAVIDYDHDLARSDSLTLKRFNDMFITNTQLFHLRDVNCWTGDTWMSAVWTLILMAPKGCNTTFLQICSDEETN